MNNLIINLFYLLVCIFAVLLVALMVLPKKVYDRIKKYFSEHKTLAEIIRFVIVGGIATLVDMFCMGVTMYFMQRSIYESFVNVFINAPRPSTVATMVGTAVGFTIGLVVNYVLSIIFVFNEKGNSKSTKGFIMFTVLSVIGLGINVLGTYIGFDLMHLNQWLVKIIMIVIVLVYNYISKKLIIFKKDSKKK